MVAASTSATQPKANTDTGYEYVPTAQPTPDTEYEYVPLPLFPRHRFQAHPPLLAVSSLSAPVLRAAWPTFA